MRHSVRACFLQTLVCASWMLALPLPALAAGGSPVHIDPASPVAKEYALPLSTARGAPPESGQSGKLFGSGIKHTAAATTTATTTTPPQAAASVSPPPPSQVAPTVTTTAATTTSTPAVRRRRPPHVTTVTLPSLTRPAAPRKIVGRVVPAAYRVLRPGSGSGLLWMLVAGVLVIALGSAGGIALRRRR
jgi:hypothetical protein